MKHQKILRWLLAKLGPKTLDDPLFGPIRFVRMRDPSESYWEGASVFAGTGTRIEYFIDADQAGPDDDQRAFVRAIAKEYPNVLKQLSPLLSRKYETWLEKALPDDIWRVFTLTSLSISVDPSHDTEWEMSFDCADDKEHLFIVPMRGWFPSGDVRIDG